MNEQFKKSIFGEISEMKVQLFLQKNKNFDPRECFRPNNSNILHHLSYEGKKQSIELYLNHTYNLIKNSPEHQQQKERSAKQKVVEWINQKNNDGFTPLLFASFNGHVDIIDLLIFWGANFTLKNNIGLGPLHVAAQNNKVSTLIYFNGKLDYNEPDFNDITPLHWASSNGSEEAVAYLLTIDGIELNKKDKEGQTPLVLATSYGNTKIVRRLLMKGASRLIKNGQNKTALEIAQQNQFQNIRKMLDNRPRLCDFLKFYYNVKVQYKPQARSLKIPIVFIITALCCILILNTQLIFTQFWLYILQGSIIGLMLLLYLSLLPSPEAPWKSPLDPQNIDKICFECTTKRPKRSYHCDICGTCIEQYDHHCTWINNCVGKRNIGRFVVFILFLLLSLGIIGVTAVIGILKAVGYGPQWNWIQLRFQKDQQWRKWARVVLFSLNIVVSLFFIPVFLLFVVQIKNLMNNKTTYQRVRGQASMRASSKATVLANCKKMCMKNNDQSFISQQSAGDQLLSH